MTFKDKILAWIYLKGTQIEEEEKQIETHLRYHPFDSLDLYEYMLAKHRLSAWKEFLGELFNIIMHSK